MALINTYLTFPGTSEEAFKFYKSVFGGEFAMVQRFGEAPGSEKVPAAHLNKMMHIALPIGKSSVLMASDYIEGMSPITLKEGNNFSLSYSADSKDEASKIFNGISAGGKVTMPMEDTFWGSYFGMATDKFGIQWMISYDVRDN